MIPEAAIYGRQTACGGFWLRQAISGVRTGRAAPTISATLPAPSPFVTQTSPAASIAKPCGPSKVALVETASSAAKLPARAPLEVNSVTLSLRFVTQALPAASIATPSGRSKLAPLGAKLLAEAPPEVNSV